jgi:hypothetical protein
MANIPGWPSMPTGVHLNPPEELSHGEGALILYGNGEIRVTGTVRGAAWALFYRVLEDSGPNTVSIEFNKSMRINCRRGQPFTLKWILPDIEKKPPFFEELAQEFTRISKLRTFV